MYNVLDDPTALNSLLTIRSLLTSMWPQQETAIKAIEKIEHATNSIDEVFVTGQPEDTSNQGDIAERLSELVNSVYGMMHAANYMRAAADVCKDTAIEPIEMFLVNELIDGGQESHRLVEEIKYLGSELGDELETEERKTILIHNMEQNIAEIKDIGSLSQSATMNLGVIGYIRVAIKDIDKKLRAMDKVDSKNKSKFASSLEKRHARLVRSSTKKIAAGMETLENSIESMYSISLENVRQCLVLNYNINLKAVEANVAEACGVDLETTPPNLSENLCAEIKDVREKLESAQTEIDGMKTWLKEAYRTNSEDTRMVAAVSHNVGVKDPDRRKEAPKPRSHSTIETPANRMARLRNRWNEAKSGVAKLLKRSQEPVKWLWERRRQIIEVSIWLQRILGEHGIISQSLGESPKSTIQSITQNAATESESSSPAIESEPDTTEECETEHPESDVEGQMGDQTLPHNG